MGEVFVTVPFAKPIPNYKHCTIAVKKNQTIMVFLQRLFDFFKNPHMYYNKQVNDLKTITYDSFAIVPPTRICRHVKKVEDLIKKACEAHIVSVVGHPCFPIWCYMWHSVVAAVTLPCLPCLEPLPETVITLWPHVLKRVNFKCY